MKNKYVMIALSFLLAFCLWLYVVTVVSPESEETYDYGDQDPNGQAYNAG